MILRGILLFIKKNFMKITIAPKFYFPLAACMGMWYAGFLSGSFFLIIAQKGNTIQSNEIPQKVCSYHSPKCTEVEKNFTTSGHPVILK